MQGPRNLIGPQLRRIRNERELSQPALAAKLQRAGWDISRDTLAKIEGQVRWVADFELVFLAQVLRVEMKDLLPRSSNTSRELILRLNRSH